MTNYERLTVATQEECSTILKGLINSPAREFCDLEQWLDSEIPELLPKGEIKNVKIDIGGSNQEEEVSAIVLGKTTIFGEQYCRLYILKPMGASNIISVPMSKCQFV